MDAEFFVLEKALVLEGVHAQLMVVLVRAPTMVQRTALSALQDITHIPGTLALESTAFAVQVMNESAQLVAFAMTIKQRERERERERHEMLVPTPRQP